MKFEDRAVAFIDILGFKTLVGQATTNTNTLLKLSDLIKLLEDAVPFFDHQVHSKVPVHLIPKHIYISDCIILSAPLSDDDRTNYNGLDVVIMRIIQLTHFFLNAGYLIRGGISVGKVWHTDANIVGPAYQEAYLLEANGDEPIVALSETAVKTSKWGTRMCLHKNGKTFVNGLNDLYIQGNTQYGAIEAAYLKYDNLAKDVLNSDVPENVKAKWRWFKEYLEAESSENQKWHQA